MSTPPEAPELNPRAAGLGCGVMGGASVVSMAFFAQAFLAPALVDLTGFDLTGWRYLAFCLVAGVVLAVIIGISATRALRQMPS